MKRCRMKRFALLVLLLCPVAVYSAERQPTQTPTPPPTQTEEPKLYDHYLSLNRMQEGLAGRSLKNWVGYNRKFSGQNGRPVNG